MALVSKIEIRNFKGIGEAQVTLEDEKVPGRFITLIGLNESGKTTVLEALSHSILADPGTSNLMETVQGAPELNDLIPKKNKAAFTGKISIKTFVTLTDTDLDKIHAHILSRHNLVPTQPFDKNITLEREYSFQDSDLKGQMNYWSFKGKTRKKGGTKIYDLTSSGLRWEWVETVGFIRDLLPQVIYFPTFLVDLPRRIYLEGNNGDIDQYYRDVINDALCSLATPLSIDKHIIARVNKHRKASASFSSTLRSSPEGQQIDATIQELSSELNRVIFGAWSDIFGKKITGRRINVEWHIDERKGRHVYLELSIVAERNVKFYISERSLGFRWFFAFLMFTQFQAFRASREKAIFLFDEPASHLHAKAQQRLLQSFGKIADPQHLIVYSTHSHYLINPIWLERAYIVSNDAINVEDDDPNDELTLHDTSIRLTKYRRFVSENPSKTTYFQPALDALDYSVSPLALSEPAILLEGKYDFYPFEYLSRAIGKPNVLRAYPALGAGAMESLIAIHRGWGVPFTILLDDDKAGRKEKQRYLDEFLLSQEEVVTLGDLSADLEGKEFEAIFGQDVRAALKTEDQGTKPKKQDFYWLFQSWLNGGVAAPDLAETKTNFARLFQALEARISAQKTSK